MNPEVPFIAFTVVGVASIAGWLLRPILVGLGRRLEGQRIDPALRAELDEMRAQHQLEVDALQQRLAELDERVDFAERLLAQPADRRQLGA